MPHIAIVTVANDIHAYTVRKELHDRHGATCDIVETDQLPASAQLSWALDGHTAPTVPTLAGKPTDVRTWDAVWYRRPGGVSWRPPHRPAVPEDITDEAVIDVIVGDSRATFLGLLLDSFQGAWVSHPDCTRSAENKIVQLRAAQRAGLRVPRTLVSQDPAAIRAFCASLDQQVLVKTVAGSRRAPLTPGMVDAELLASDRALALSPAIYQEAVPGTCHLRVQAFGDELIAVMIRSDALDWRFALASSTVEPYTLSADLQRRLRQVLQILGLRMGVFDIKLTPRGEPVWLEVNPQGQFLFVEGMSDTSLAAPFADFLVREANGPLRVAA